MMEQDGNMLNWGEEDDDFPLFGDGTANWRTGSLFGLVNLSGSVAQMAFGWFLTLSLHRRHPY